LINIPSEQTLWKTAAIGFGLIVGVAIIFIMQYLNLLLYPIPESANISQESEYIEFIRDNHPFLLGIFVSNAAGCLVAGGLAKIIRHDLTRFHSFIAGFVLMILGYVNFLMIPHPWWFLILSLFAYIPFSWLGFAIVEKRLTN
jgi:hypothetical protein